MTQFTNYLNFKKNIGRNILAIDYGEKVIGLASFCPGKDPYPLVYGKIINKGLKRSLLELAQVIENDFFEIAIFGIPYLTDGSESKKTQEMKKLFSIFQTEFPKIEFISQDETLTTFTAKERMTSSPEFNFKVDMTKIDEVSAVIILEDYIRED